MAHKSALAKALTVSPNRIPIDNQVKKFDVQEAVKLRFINKLTFQEIADKFGVSPQAVFKRIRGLIEIINDPQLNQAYADNRAELLTGAERVLLSAVVDREKIKSASLNNAAYALRQVHDMRRLEQDLSTANIAQNIKARSMADDDRKALERALQSMYEQGSCQDVKVEENKAEEAESVGKVDTVSPIKEAENPSTNDFNKLD